MTTKVWTALTYLIVGILALWLTTTSTQIERNDGRVEGGFPFVNMADNLWNPTGRGSLSFGDDYLNTPGILANITVYGAIVLTIWRLVQSGYTRQLHASLSYLMPCAALAGLCFVGASRGYNPFPSPQYHPATPTAVPEHEAALIRTWQGVDATTGQPFTLQFKSQALILNTADGAIQGAYTWSTPEQIVIGLGRYTVLSPETESPPCPVLPSMFEGTCQQELVRGYPAPVVATPGSQVPASGYPAPDPMTVATDALFQGITTEYQIVVTRTNLTLTTPTGAVQTFTAVP